MSATLTGVVTPGVRAALRGQDPTPEQLAAVTAPIGPVHVIAGAGSGKTAVMASSTWSSGSGWRRRPSSA